MMHRLDDYPRVQWALSTFGPAVVIVAAQMVLFRMPPGAYAFGVTLGLMNALVAIGMALIYRANRILNFAQSDLGFAPTVLAVDLIAFSGLNYVVAFGLGLAAAIIIGAAIEFLIIRRFFRAPRLILTVATIGLSQLLLVGAAAMPLIWGQDKAGKSVSYSLFDGWKFEIRPVTLNATHLAALIVAPLAMAAVAIFLRKTNAGIAIRASAERADRASLLGVPVKRLQTLVWVIATVLSFIGVFLRAGVIGLPVVSQLSYLAVLAALAAVMLGNLTNLPSIAACAIALGIMDEAVQWNNSNRPDLYILVLAIIIVGGLLFRKVGQGRAEHDTASTWQAAEEVRPIPKELRKVPEVVLVRWVPLALVCVAALIVPAYFSPGNQTKAAGLTIFCIIGISVIMLTGWAGQVSLGQFGFVAVGSVVTAYARVNWNLDLSLCMVLSAIAGAAAAVVVGLPALRLRGLFLAVTTLAFASAMSAYLLSTKYQNWIPKERFERLSLFGRLDLTSELAMYYLGLACLVVTLLAVRGIRRSRVGRVLLALRENERGIQSYGVNIVRAKLMAFALSGALASFAGSLFVYLQQSHYDNAYDASQSFGAFTSTVVGGLGSMAGAFLGAFYFQGGTWFLNAPWSLLPSAIGVLLVLMILPGGLGGLVFQLRDIWLRSVARRNGIIVPSLLADVQQDPEVLEHAEMSVERHEGGGDSPPGGELPPPPAIEGRIDGAPPAASRPAAPSAAPSAAPASGGGD